MPRISTRVLPSISLCLLGACTLEPWETADAEAAADQIDILDLGSADGDGFPVTETHLGEPLGEQAVAALPPGAEAHRELLATAMKVYRFQVEAGESFAVVMRRTGQGDLDPHLILKDPEGRTIAKGREQAALPMAEEVDAVITVTAPTSGDFVVFASSPDFRSGGTFTLDLIPLESLPENVDLGLTNPEARAYADALRGYHNDVTGFVEEGALFEGGDGLLSVAGSQPSEMPLRAWVEARRLEGVVNELRLGLFGALAGASVDETPSPEAIAAVGATCAELWRYVYLSDLE